MLGFNSGGRHHDVHFPIGKLGEEAQHEKQKVQLEKKIADTIAKQLLALVEVGPPELTRQTVALQGRPENKLLPSIMVLVRNEAWPIAEPAVAGAKVVLAPTVTKFDAQGRALAELATVHKRTVAIDILPWAKWVESETPCPDHKLAKLVLETVVRQFHRQLLADPPPIAMMRIGKVIQMRAKETITKGGCVIPIFSGKHTPWLWKANRMECDLAMASTARLTGLGGL